MIHYICDRCQRTMNPEQERRYILHIEVEVIAEESDPIAMAMDDEESVDHLASLNDNLEAEILEEECESLEYLNELLCRGDDLGSTENLGPCDQADQPALCSPSISSTEDSHSNALNHGEEGSAPASFDLCCDCYAKYAGNPLSVDRKLKLQFSNN